MILVIKGEYVKRKRREISELIFKELNFENDFIDDDKIEIEVLDSIKSQFIEYLRKLNNSKNTIEVIE